METPISTRRNPLICDIFSRLGFMERRGSGIKKIMDAYEKDKKKPKIETFGTIFKITFYSRLYKTEQYPEIENNYPPNILKQPQYYGEYSNMFQKHPKTSESIRKHPKELVLEYIRNNPNSSRKYIIEDLGLTEGQVKNALKVLKQANMIISIGKGKNTSYIVKGNR